MLETPELPECCLTKEPTLISPSRETPKHLLYLSNLDNQKFLRFSIKYLYVFKKSVSLDHLKSSLSKVLVDYYPLAGRLRKSLENDQELVVDCNGEGAVFAEAFMDISAQDFLGISGKPNRSWRKLLYRVEAHSFLDSPQLIVQVTNLQCGGMILCTAISHCLCDGIGTSQFLHAWAHITRQPDSTNLPIKPFHSRHAFKQRNSRQTTFTCPSYVKTTQHKDNVNLDIHHSLQSQPLVPSSLTFTSSDISRLKRQCEPSLKCTAFEALASHTWRCWVKSLDLPPSSTVKLLFSVNVRRQTSLEIPEGYYGNGFVLGCAITVVADLVTTNLGHGVKLVQEAKSNITDGYVRSVIDMVEDKTVEVDLSMSLVISQWAKLGLDELDFGEGNAVHMGSLTSDIYCLFLPVMGDTGGVRVQVSMPENAVEKYEFYMRGFLEKEDHVVNGGDEGYFEKKKT